MLRSHTALSVPLIRLGVAHEREDRRLWDDKVALALEGDLDGRLAEEERVVAGAGLHGHEARLAHSGPPRLVPGIAEVGHWEPRPGGDDAPSLHRLVVD